MKSIDWWLVTVLSLLAFMIGGFHFGIDQDAYYLPLVQAKLSSLPLYTGDSYVHALTRYATVYYDAIAFIARFTGIAIAFLIFHLLTIYFFISVIFLLSHDLFSSRKVALFSSLFLFLPKSALGGINLGANHSYIYQSFTALPFALLSIHFFIRRHLSLSFITASLITYIHSVTSLPLLAFLSLSLILQKQFRPACVNLLLALSLITPFIWQNFNSGLLTESGNFADWLYLNRLRNSHHLFPDTWSLSTWLKGLWLSLVLIKFKNLRILAVSALSLFLFAFMFTSIYPIRPIIQLQFFRLSLVTTALGWISLTYFILNRKLLKFALIPLLIILTLKPGHQNPFKAFALPDHDQYWIQAQYWVKLHTQPEDRIYILPDSPTFRGFSQRSTNITWPEMTYILADNKFTQDSLLSLRQPLRDLDKSRFIVLPNDYPWDGTFIYRNPQFSVYPGIL